MRGDDTYETLLRYLDGELTHAEALSVEMAIEEDANLQAQYDWLAGLHAELRPGGQGACQVDLRGAVAARIAGLSPGECEALAAQTPDPPEVLPSEPVAPLHWVQPLAETLLSMATPTDETSRVDLREDVLAAIWLPQEGAGQRVQARWGRSPALLQTAWWALAAAALVLVGLGGFWLSAKRSAPADRPETAARSTSPAEDVPQREAVREAMLDEEGRIGPVPDPEGAGSGDVFEETAPAGLTLPDVMTARRSVGNDPTAWASLKKMASLRTDEARSVATGPGQSAAAVSGAAMSLPPGEQAAALRSVVGELEDPAAGWMLLSRAAAKEQHSDEAIAAARQAHAMHPENGMALYLEAREHLALGDVDGALTLLEQASASPLVSAFGLENARLRREALKAAGAEPRAAAVSAALAMGLDEYDFLCTLGGDLLEYARYYENNRQSAVAGALREAALTLGKQLSSESPSAAERLAGLDIQADALEALGKDESAPQERIEELAVQGEALAAALGDLQVLFDSLGVFLATAVNAESWVEMANAILEEGDVIVMTLLGHGEGSGG